MSHFFVCVHTWSTLSTVMAALVASLMPQCLTRYGSSTPLSSMSFSAGPSPCSKRHIISISRQKHGAHDMKSKHWMNGLFRQQVGCAPTSNTLTHLNVEAHVLVPLVMCGVQLGDQFVSLHAGVLGQRPWKSLKGLSKLLDGVLLQTGARLQRHTDEFTCHVGPAAAGEAERAPNEGNPPLRTK